MKTLCWIALFLGLGTLNAEANFFDVAQISSSGMDAQRKKMDIIAENIANVDTVQTPERGAYRRKIVILGQGMTGAWSALSTRFGSAGVRVVKTATDPTPFKKIYEPANPYADSNGYVEVPNINTVQEMVDMISSTRAYEANIQVFNASKSMAQRALSIGK